MTTEEVEKMLEDTSARLSEHFENVQIMVSWNEDALTKACLRGNGNWYARQGLAHRFIEMDFAEEQANQIAKAVKPPPDEGEEWKV